MIVSSRSDCTPSSARRSTTSQPEPTHPRLRYTLVAPANGAPALAPRLVDGLENVKRGEGGIADDRDRWLHREMSDPNRDACRSRERLFRCRVFPVPAHLRCSPRPRRQLRYAIPGTHCRDGTRRGSSCSARREERDAQPRTAVTPRHRPQLEGLRSRAHDAQGSRSAERRRGATPRTANQCAPVRAPRGGL